MMLIDCSLHDGQIFSNGPILTTFSVGPTLRTSIIGSFPENYHPRFVDMVTGKALDLDFHLICIDRSSAIRAFEWIHQREWVRILSITPHGPVESWDCQLPCYPLQVLQKGGYELYIQIRAAHYSLTDGKTIVSVGQPRLGALNPWLLDER